MPSFDNLFLLAEAGYGPAGKKLSAERTFGYYGDYSVSENVTYQQMLAAVGIDMKLNRIDVATFSTGIYKRDFEDFGSGFGAGGEPRTRSLESKFGKGGRQNFGGMTSPETEAALKEMKTTTDEKRQRE